MIPALLMRLSVGYFFMETGWAKVHNLDAFATRFAQWGIPYPAFNAALSACTEFVPRQHKLDRMRRWGKRAFLTAWSTDVLG